MENEITFEKIGIEIKCGIDLAQVDDLKKITKFICPICKKLVYDPLACEENECVFCRKCIEEWSQNKDTCPNCNKIFKITNKTRIIKNFLSLIKLKCFYFEKGCKETPNYENYENHVKNCDHIEYKCLGCDYISNKKDLLSHTSNCNLISIKCEFCDEKIQKKDIDSHVSQCKKAFSECIVCNDKNVLNFELINHNQGKCFAIFNKAFNLNSILQKNGLEKFKEDIDKSVLKLELTDVRKSCAVLESEIKEMSQELSLLRKEKLELNEKISELKEHSNKKCQHQLIMINSGPTRACDKCFNKLECRVYCRLCSIYLCIRCSVFDNNKCPIGHIFSKGIRGQSFKCDICFKNYFFSAISNFDLKCDIDICETCFKNLK